MGKRVIGISYEDRLLLCFLAGVVGGTVAANLFCVELQSRVGYFDAWLTAGRELDGAIRQEMWHYVLQQRVPEFLGLWLVSLTVFSAAGFSLLMGVGGVAAGVSVSILTMQKGIAGILIYPVTLFPHTLCYIPVCLFLARRAGEKGRSFRLAGMAVLGAVWLLGTLLEVYINPLISQFLLYKF